jgi:hypothetical protein
MRAAYVYAEEGGEPPIELETAWRVQDIGAEAVLGVNAPARIVRRVALAGSVYRAFVSRRDYRDQHGAENWAEWAARHTEQNRLLNMAARDGESQ